MFSLKPSRKLFKFSLCFFQLARRSTRLCNRKNTLVPCSISFREAVISLHKELAVAPVRVIKRSFSQCFIFFFAFVCVSWMEKSRWEKQFSKPAWRQHHSSCFLDRFQASRQSERTPFETVPWSFAFVFNGFLAFSPLTRLQTRVGGQRPDWFSQRTTTPDNGKNGESFLAPLRGPVAHLSRAADARWSEALPSNFLGASNRGWRILMNGPEFVPPRRVARCRFHATLSAAAAT